MHVMGITCAMGQTDTVSVENDIHKPRTNLAALSILGPTYFASVSYSKFISPQFNTEIGLGLIGFYGGIKYHKWFAIVEGGEKISPYIGFIYTYSIDFLSDSTDVLVFGNPTGGIYLPLGLHFAGRDGFSLAAEVSRIWLVDANFSFNKRSFYWAGLKIGYAF